MGYHSADYDHDWRIGAAELARVVTLYNTTFNSARTGCYKVDSSTIDGFAPDPTRSATEPVTLTHYHSADYNRDGRIDDAELERVTELYNYRYENVDIGGTVRTGQYHDNNPFSLDGFGLGPVSLSDYSFDVDHKPTINSNWTPSGQSYRLRAKFNDGTAEGFQAATTYQNNGLVLDSLPDAGVYSVSLRWIQYNSNGDVYLIGNEQIVTVTIGEADTPCTNPNSTKCVCGDPIPIENEEKAQCFPLRVKRSCNAPDLPIPPCNDNDYQTIYDPTKTPPFYVVSALRDSNCEVITDADGNPIMTKIS